ncbi:MAG: nuclear transport factor 2 family protein [Hydrogenophaga sp.]|nr:nuclear transport factor 2 family protein [Hydrogenophaga sp.]
MHTMHTIHPGPVHMARAQLRAINHRTVHALVVPDTAFIGALVDPDFLFTSSDGEWIDRARYLARLGSPPAVHGVSCVGVRVRLYGTVALVQGTVQAPLSQGGLARLRYTDVYLRRDTTWRLVNCQHTAVQPGVPTTPRPGLAPQHAAWTGQCPQGDELEVLHSLNAQYVQAYRDADVAWYDAHLAPDYNAVQGDGTWSDRASALTRFAQPSYALHMRSFPVDRVTVRRFGEVALIHAENAYTLKDGREGVSRYTDIWHRQRSHWKCVSAHITEHQQPA